MSDSELSASTGELGPLPERWYCVNADGLALLCESQEDAERYATGLDGTYPSRAPHRAVLLGDVAAERERCAAVCERLAAEALAEMLRQPVSSPARDRYFARREALRGAAVEVRLGPNAGDKGPLSGPAA